MAEWGKYLKNAVANVEQQLDKVLLDNQEGQTGASTPRPARTRPDLSERLRLAAAGKATPKTASPAPTAESEAPAAAQAPVSPKTASDAAKPSSDLPSEQEAPQTPDPSSSAHAEAAEEIRLLTVREFASPPDFSEALSRARALALAVKSDAAVGVVDALEGLEQAADRFVANVDERLASLHSKVALLSARRAVGATGADQRIALLLEEGQKLSQQELKLGQLVKRLRADKRDAEARADRLAAKDQASDAMRRELTQLRAQTRELEALVSHYRAQLTEETPGGRERAPDAAAPDPDQLAAEREKWQRLESQLLLRITELEAANSQRHSSTSQLQQSLAAAQRASREAQDQVVMLQDQLDALKESSQRELAEALARLPKQEEAAPTNEPVQELSVGTEASLHRTSDHHPEETGTNPDLDPDLSPDREIVPDPRMEPPLAAAPDLEIDPRDMSHPRLHIERPHPDLESSHPSDRSRLELPHINHPHVNHPHINHPHMDHSLNLPSFHSPFDELSEVGDEQTVGPAGPFGALEDTGALQSLSVDEGLYGIENETRRSHDSLSFLAGNLSRQDSIADSLNDSSNSHLVKKLTLSVRRLRNELSAARQEAQLARQQRQEAQTEIVKYLGAQEQLEALQRQHGQLTADHAAAAAEIARLNGVVSDKGEEIAELDADVRDLKEMYKEQIEALVDEIEKLKKK